MWGWNIVFCRIIELLRHVMIRWFILGWCKRAVKAIRNLSMMASHALSLSFSAMKVNHFILLRCLWDFYACSHVIEIFTEPASLLDIWLICFRIGYWHWCWRVVWIKEKRIIVARICYWKFWLSFDDHIFGDLIHEFVDWSCGRRSFYLRCVVGWRVTRTFAMITSLWSFLHS